MTFKNADEANAFRWTRDGDNYYEIYYLTLNQLENGAGFWIRYTLHAPKGCAEEAYSEVWFTYYNPSQPEKNFGLAEKFHHSELESKSNPFSVRIGDNHLNNGTCKGYIEGGGHKASWDLQFDPSPSPFLHFPESLYSSGEVESAMLSPHFNTRFSGCIEVDGTKIELTNDPGEQSHTWGRAHPAYWLWCHCNYFDGDDDASVELVCAPPENANEETIHVLYVAYDGLEHRMMSLLDGSTSTNEAAPGNWKLVAESASLRIEAEISAVADNLIEAHYTDPDGRSAYCVACEVASSKIHVYTRNDPSDDWGIHRTLTSKGTTHVEWGYPQQRHDVKKKVFQFENASYRAGN